jgi:hypothetical protein
MASDHVREIELLRKLQLDYLRAHHELMWELLSKQTLLQWKLLTKYDGWPLNGAIASYVDISIRSLNILEKIGLYESQQGSLGHRFLREWRNLYHHEEPILFQPFEGKIRLGADESSEVMEIPAGFYTFFVIHEMRGVKTPTKGLKSFLDNFSVAAGGDQAVQLSTLSGAINANHIFLCTVIVDAHRRKWESLPSTGVRLPAFLPDRAMMSTVGQSVLGDEIWSA